jgi:DNA helicase IV
MGPSPDSFEVEAEQGRADWLQEVIDVRIADLRSQVERQEDPRHRAAMDRQYRGVIKRLAAARNELVKHRVDLESGEIIYFGKVLLPDPGRPGEFALVNWESDLWSVYFVEANRSDPLGVGRRRTIRMNGRLVVDLSDEYLVDGFKPERDEREPIPRPPESKASDWELTRGPTDQKFIGPTAPAKPPEPIANGDSDSKAATDIPVERAGGVTGGPDGDPPESGSVDDLSIRAADLLLRELEEARSGSMGEVVATIQAEQDRLIRSDLGRALVIQGGPGTGKTVVALHRAAWVMYEQQRVGTFGDPTGLVIGPNRVFMDYISGVLPSLGRAEIRQHAFSDLARLGLNEADRSATEPRRSAATDEARVKGDPRMADVLAQAVWRHARPEELELGFRRFVLKLNQAEVLGLIRRLFDQRTPYAQARDELRRLTVAAFAARLDQRGELTASGGPSSRDLERTLSAHLKETRWMERVLPKVNPRSVLLRLFTDDDFRSACTINLTPTARQALAATTSRRRYVWSDADGALLDEVATVIRGAPQRFSHVVVDEAQDLSPMDWRVVRRRVTSALTVTGDIGQATSAWAVTSWDDLVDRAGIDDVPLYSELRIGYRVPEEVMLFAGQLLAEAAPEVGLPRSFRQREGSVSVVRTTKSKIRELLLQKVAALGATGGRVAVIGHESDVPPIRAALQGQGDVEVLTPQDCKGLEFDHVVVVEPKSITEGVDRRSGLRRLFVCLTRSTMTLTVLHTRHLPPHLARLQPERVSARQHLRLRRLELIQAGSSKRDAERAIWAQHGRRWTAEDDAALKRQVDAGLTLEQVADLHGRRPGAVAARCRKVGLPVPPPE